MPEDTKTPASEDGNLKSILEHIKMQDEKITQLTNNMSKVIEFNTNLLNNKPNSEANNDSDKASARHEELRKKLLGGLK